MNHEPTIFIIIVAAGSGSRFGSEMPKQFCDLAGKPVLMHTIDCFRKALPGAQIITVISHKHLSMWNDLCAAHSFDSPATVTGGASRWESVKKAVDHIAGEATEDSIIMVHDGARPLVGNELIARVVSAAKHHTGVIPVIPVTDSLRLVNPDGTSTPADRSLYRAVQTPQAFNGRLLANAYNLPYRADFTDDASVMAAAGHHDIALVDGDPHNIKITLRDDLAIALLYL